jgi:acetylornithine deacetylase
MHAIVDGCAAHDPQFRATVTRGLDRAPMQTAPDHAIVQTLRQHAEAIVGQPVPLVGAAYWTDAASLTEAGIPAVLFGPTGDGAHAVEEWVDLTSCEHCATIYTRVAQTFCA